MDLYDAMSTLRAVRRLKPDPVDDALLRKVLTAATFAPTGGNMQPWRIVAVRDAEAKQQLEDLYRPHWESYLPGYRKKTAALTGDALEKSNRAVDAGTYLATHMHEVPVIAVFCFNPDTMTITDADQPRPSVVGGGSVYPAVQNLLLACRNEGLGCVLTTLLCIEEPSVREIIGLPDGWYTCAHVPIGWPVGGGHGPISRRDLNDMVYEDRWGSPLG